MSQKLGRNIRFLSNPSRRGPLTYKLPNSILGTFFQRTNCPDDKFAIS